MNEIKTVTISEKEYHELLDRDQFLSALEAAGVDNWDGFGEAVDLVKEWNKESGDE